MTARTCCFPPCDEWNGAQGQPAGDGREGRGGEGARPAHAGKDRRPGRMRKACACAAEQVLFGQGEIDVADRVLEGVCVFKHRSGSAVGSSGNPLPNNSQKVVTVKFLGQNAAGKM